MGARISLLGGFDVDVDGTVVPAREWNRRQSASLVKLLALAPGRRLHREQVLDALWPDLLVDEAAPRLHKAAHYARRALRSANSVVLTGEMVALWPGSDEVVIDVEEFERAAEAALATADPGAAEEAAAAYGGDLLPHDRYESWCQTPREHLSAMHRDLLRLAERWEELVAVDPADEDAHVALIRRSLEEGDRPGALRQYERLERALAAELGLKPGRAAQALRTELLTTSLEAPAAESEVPEPIGRAHELSTLDALLQGMPGGRGRVLFVGGPPGSGKTALLTTLLARARRRHIRAGLGVAATVEAPWPYAPVLEALADLCRRHPALLDGLQDSFRVEIERALSGRDLLWTGTGGHQRLFVAVVELMRLAAAGHGALLVIDDAHSADPESLRLLHYLSRATANDAVLLVLAHRPRPAPAELVTLRRAASARGSGVVLALQPLSQDDTAAVVRRVVPDADDSLVQHVWEVSRGSPLAATELAHAAGTARGEVSLSRLWLHALPRTVLEALRAAAVLGTTFDTDEFVAVTAPRTPDDDGEALDEREAFTALERALRARVVVRTERGFAFRHALVRDAVLEGVAAHDLRELHRRAAEALQRLDGSPARIAHHLVQGGDRAAAVPYVLRAAETEAALGAYGSALTTLDSVRGQARGEHLARCLELRADCLMARADAGATSAYRDALAVQTDTRSRSRLRARLARAAVFTGDLQTAADALAGLELDGSDTDGDVLLARGNLAMFQGDLDAADAAAAEARRRLTEVSGNDWRLFDLVALQGLVAHKRGQWFERLRLELRRGRERPDLAVGIFDSHLCVSQYLLYGATPYDEVMELAADLRTTAQHSGVLRAVGFATALRGEAALLHGDLELAEQELTDSLHLHHELGLSSGEAHALQRLAEVHLARGERELAVPKLERALVLARWSPVALHLIHRIVGSLIQAQPDPAAARAMVDRAVETMSHGDHCFLCIIMFEVPATRACAAVGDLQEARAHLAAAEESAGRWEGTGWPAAVLEARASIADAEGDRHGAARMRAKATTLYEAAGQLLDAERCRAAAV
jgi:DNA-binding SARP family transcriptional activator/tetratricopeptide (TPR) repeat protein